VRASRDHYWVRDASPGEVGLDTNPDVVIRRIELLAAFVNHMFANRTANSFRTVFAGGARPAASTVHFGAGQMVAIRDGDAAAGSTGHAQATLNPTGPTPRAFTVQVKGRGGVVDGIARHACRWL